MKTLTWSPEALHDLESIRAYIAQNSESYADLTVRRLIAAVDRLRHFPESGRVVPERDEASIREVIFDSYRVVYRLTGDRVEIVTIFRGSRVFPSIT